MNDAQREQRLIELLAPALGGLGLVLWGLELHRGGHHGVLRIFVEAEGEEGVTIDQCARASRHMSVLLDVEDIIPGSYTLEVSSPGLDRPFFSPAQMEAYVGREVEVRLAEPMGEPFPGRRKFAGELKSVDGPRLALHVDGRDVEISWPAVKKARLVHHF